MPRPMPLLAPVMAMVLDSSVMRQWWSEGGMVDLKAGIEEGPLVVDVCVAPLVVCNGAGASRSAVAAGGMMTVSKHCSLLRDDVMVSNASPSAQVTLHEVECR